MEEKMGKGLKGSSGQKLDNSQQGDCVSLSEIQIIFREKNLLDKKISIEHEGELYRLLCSAESFIVYRVNQHQHVPPGIPGWPVCLVNENTKCNECEMPSVDPSHLTCDLKLSDWMHKVRQYCQKKPED
jgi:hypothetical protein